MNDELVGIWKEVAQLRPLLSGHFSGLTEGNHDKPRSEQSVSWQRLEPSNSQIQIPRAVSLFRRVVEDLSPPMARFNPRSVDVRLVVVAQGLGS